MITEKTIREESYAITTLRYEGLTAAEWESLADEKANGTARKFSGSDVPNHASASDCRLIAQTLDRMANPNTEE